MKIKYRIKMGLSPIVDGRHTMEFGVSYDFNEDFYLQDFGASPNIAKPIYGNALAKVYEAEGDSFRFRAKLSGAMMFTGANFDTINSMTLDDIMLIDIEMSKDGGATWATYHRAFFTKTDCEIDYDNRRVSVSIQSLDGYTNILAGLTKEYDLVKLAPEISRVSFDKRPLLQIYALGDVAVTCYQGASVWEVDTVKVISTDQEIQNLGFKMAGQIRTVNLIGLASDLDGVYFGAVWNTGDTIYSDIRGQLVKKNDSSCYINYSYNYHNGFYFPDIALYQNGALVANYTSDVTGYSGELRTFAIGGGTGAVLKNNFYSRILTDKEEVNGVATVAISEDDIVPNSGFARALSWASEANPIYTSITFSDEPTEWGQSIDGDYFESPPNLGKVQPLAQSLWRATSYWFVPPYDWGEIQEAGKKEYWISHTYPLYSVIQRLLAEVAPELSFLPTTAYSEFLYGRGGEIRIDDFQLYITPKSNVALGDYKSPAQTAIITLQNVLDMLQNVYQLYWFVDDGKLRIEHVQFFLNGGSYDENSVEVDLTTAINPRSGKSWAHGQSTIKYDKADLPERYEFGWMDNVTEAFVGEPIEILSPSVDKGNITKVVVDKFTSDLDYVLQNSSEISSEGFVLLAATTDSFITSTVQTPSTIEFTPKTYAREATLEAYSSYATSLRVDVYNGDIVVWSLTIAINGSVSRTVRIPADADSVSFSSLSVVIINEFKAKNEAHVKNVEMGDYLYQNGYASFRYIHPRFWIYNLPSRNVKINGETMVLSQARRTAQQTVIFPSIEDINPLKLIRTNVGDGLITSVSVTLPSRRIEAVLKYER